MTKFREAFLDFLNISSEPSGVSPTEVNEKNNEQQTRNNRNMKF